MPQPINALIKHVPKRDPRDMMAAGSVVPLIRSSSTEGSTEGSLLAGHMGSMGGGTPTLHDFNTHSSAFASSTPGLMTNGSLGPLSEEGVTSTDITMESGALFPDDDDQDVLQSVVVQQKCDRGNLAGALQKSDMFKTDKGVVNLVRELVQACSYGCCACGPGHMARLLSEGGLCFRMRMHIGLYGYAMPVMEGLTPSWQYTHHNKTQSMLISVCVTFCLLLAHSMPSSCVLVTWHGAWSICTNAKCATGT